MDISETLHAKSDQLNASDLSGGPITVTIESVNVQKNAEQPVSINLVGMKGKPYKPSKGMRRVIAQAWGADSDAYPGRTLTLYRNPDVLWAGEPVGGIEISAMSHIDGPMKTSVRLNRKSARTLTVQPLADAPPPTDWHGLIQAADGDVDTLRAMWQDASSKGADQSVLDAIKDAANAASKDAA